MDIVRLRIMTMKSTIDWGYKSGKRVSDLVNEDPKYLVYVYYNHREHSFNDEVLNAIGITTDLRIDKPGVNNDMWFAFMTESDRDYYNSQTTEEEKKKAFDRCMKRGLRRFCRDRRHDLIAAEARLSKLNSKGSLAWKNQGH